MGNPLDIQDGDAYLPIPSPGSDSEDSRDAVRLAQDLIRKLDEDSRRKLDQVSAFEKTSERGAA